MTIAPLTTVTIDRLGRRGEGVASTPSGRVYVPYALPGETVGIDREGERGTLVSLKDESPERIAPICPYYGTCGGCAVQALAPAPYAAWKRGLLIEALARAGLAPAVAPLVDAHGRGRRRATFHAKIERGRPRLGFMQARSHEIVPIETCPILDPGLDGALPAARAIAAALAETGKPLDLVALTTESGLDLDLRGQGPLDDRLREKLIAVAAAHDLARLANHGLVLIERRKPWLHMGPARVIPPPGAFLQATAAGEAVLAAHVVAALPGAKRIADLFAGLGTFALRLAATAEVDAFDSEAPALAALDRAARETDGLRTVRVATRDLFRRPLQPDELDRWDAVVLDPPRAGAEAQMRALAASRVTRIVSVACDATTFARDAALLVGAGYEIGDAIPIDQFRYSPHLEIVAVFTRPAPKQKRRLLG